jgi:integrase/recombinase XerD
MTQEFIRERQYLKAVSPHTLIWYGCSFKAFEGALDSKEAIRERIVHMRQRNVSPITINSYLRCINAYLRWLHEEHGKEFLKIPKLKEEQKILQTFSTAAIQKIVSHKPKTQNERRLHTLVCMLFDTGLRISEALTLTWQNVDLDNLVLKINGKGGKHRLVPISLEYRKLLWRWLQKQGTPNTGLVYPTRTNTEITVRNFLHSFKALGKNLGITGVRISPHTCRHTFACEYLRRGGNLEFLRRILGHSSILTTQRYLRSLGVADIQAAHEGLSPLTVEHRS